mmetsp:Transcript_33314/g.55076  ORF Transcript_33314/g.55076 Transcript_33314/m.55076 type:complete len:91 (-) Transcript_33314:197-469(-)
MCMFRHMDVCFYVCRVEDRGVGVRYFWNRQHWGKRFLEARCARNTRCNYISWMRKNGIFGKAWPAWCISKLSVERAVILEYGRLQLLTPV